MREPLVEELDDKKAVEDQGGLLQILLHRLLVSGEEVDGDGPNMGFSKMRLLTNNPKKTSAFIYDGFNLEVVNQVPIVAPSNPHNERYLATKRDKLGHNLPE